MRIVAIVNPVSGAGMNAAAVQRRVAMIRDELTRRGLDAAICVTERAGHARELAVDAAARGSDLVIAWGGDGTVNEVGGGLVGSSTALGLIPAGSGNGLAGALGVPRDPRKAIATALTGVRRPIDVGLVNDRLFFNVAGVGFDAHIARLFNARPSGQRGRLPYVMLGVREGIRYAAQRYRVTLDRDPATELDAFLIAFANGPEYGMGMRIAPTAQLDDGWLEACVVWDRPVIARFIDARHFALGTMERAPRMVLRSVQRATVEADGDIPFHVDGEPAVARHRLDVALRPGAVIVAATSAP